MNRLFLSYAHADETLRGELEKHLAVLKRENAIDVWHDRRIVPGERLHNEIARELEQAEIILLLVSADFLNSDYCIGVELKRALELEKEGKARVIPIILRPCDWRAAPFGHLAALPRDGRPITLWADLDQAFLDVVEGLRVALPPRERSAKTQVTEPAHPVVSTRPRSSNLRIRQAFSDADKHRFLEETFEFMARFFENSIEELRRRQPTIDGVVTRIDARRFGAVLYRNGTQASQCEIRLNTAGRGFGAGITYSNEYGGFSESYNESLSAEAGDQHLYLRPMGLATMHGESREPHLSKEGASEMFWEMLIEALQR